MFHADHVSSPFQPTLNVLSTMYVQTWSLPTFILLLSTRFTPVIFLIQLFEHQLHRAHQTAKCRLRTHHALLNAHIHRIKKEHQAKCVYCPDNYGTGPLNISYSTAHCTTTSDPDYCQLNHTQHAIWINCTTATNSHLQYVSQEQT